MTNWRSRSGPSESQSRALAERESKYRRQHEASR